MDMDTPIFYKTVADKTFNKVVEEPKSFLQRLFPFLFGPIAKGLK